MMGRVPVTILHPFGELDTSNYQQLIAAAQAAYDTGARDMVLDLTDVPFLSSPGLAALQIVSILSKAKGFAVAGQQLSSTDGFPAAHARRSLYQRRGQRYHGMECR
jgi:anti-anti-sigma factor